jgi:hypothetical protein
MQVHVELLYLDWTRVPGKHAAATQHVHIACGMYAMMTGLGVSGSISLSFCPKRYIVLFTTGIHGHDKI